jgi:hypothetical protein
MSSVRVRTAAELARTRGLSREEHAAILGLVTGSAAPFDAVDNPVVLDILGGRDFEWPEFDRWQALFASRSAGSASSRRPTTRRRSWCASPIAVARSRC